VEGHPDTACFLILRDDCSAGPQANVPPVLAEQGVVQSRIRTIGEMVRGEEERREGEMEATVR